MGFNVRAFDKILKGTVSKENISNRDGYDDTIAVLCHGHHVSHVTELDQPRRHQVQLLDKVIAMLTEDREQTPSYSKERECARILTGMMLLQLAIISKTYKENLFDAFKINSSSFRSILFRSLMLNLGFIEPKLGGGFKATEEAKKLEFEDISLLIGEAYHFIEKTVYIDGDSRKGFKQVHEFSSIPELEIPSYFKICHGVIFDASNRKVDRNVKDERNVQILAADQEEEQRAANLIRDKESSARKKGSSSWTLNIFGKSSKGQLPASEEDEQSAIHP